jgi:CheY-like chemotaxis protein
VTPVPLTAPPQRVLIVDDHTDSALMIMRGLAALGYTVEIAHDAPTALLAARSFAPDVVLLDIMLPVIDGYELGNRLRERGVQHLVAVTGLADAERSQLAGFDAHFVKPIDLFELERVLRGLQ